MLKRIGLLIVLLMSTTVLPGTAAAAPMPHLLTITGTRNSYATLTVAKTVQYTLGYGEGILARRSDHEEPKVDYLSGGGQYGGFAIGRDTVTLWAKQAPEMPVMQGHASVMHGGTWTNGVLKPGRYKIYLFAEEGYRVKVTIPWTGPDLSLSADAPTDTKVQIKSALITGAGPVEMDLPQDGRRGVNTDTALVLDTIVDPTVILRTCLTKDVSSCDKARWRGSMAGKGTALNGHGLGLGFYNDPYPTKGYYIRGEVSGVNNGIATFVSLRYYWQ